MVAGKAMVKEVRQTCLELRMAASGCGLSVQEQCVSILSHSFPLEQGQASEVDQSPRVAGSLAHRTQHLILWDLTWVQEAKVGTCCCLAFSINLLEGKGP